MVACETKLFAGILACAYLVGLFTIFQRRGNHAYEGNEAGPPFYELAWQHTFYGLPMNPAYLSLLVR